MSRNFRATTINIDLASDGSRLQTTLIDMCRKMSSEKNDKLIGGMPYAEVLKYLKNNSYDEVPKKTKVKLIYGLCELYSVSEVVALRRVNEVISLAGEGYLPK